MKYSSNFSIQKSKKAMGVSTWNTLAKYVLLAIAFVLIYLIVKGIAKKILSLYS